jgi:hypothetical protein
MQTFLKPFKKLAGRVLLGLKPLALRARGFKPNKTLLLVFEIVLKEPNLSSFRPWQSVVFSQ